MQPIEFKYPEQPEQQISEHILQNNTPAACTSIELDLRKLKDVWGKDVYGYSGVGGRDRKEERIEILKNEIASGSTYMPIIFLTDMAPEGLSFEDGRHRTAVLIEAGYETAMFVVPSHQAEQIKKFFGP
ncbi:hypothetical protein [Pseudodesulfovibrio pelocollis]|uniref:hypothetical protein n=1 Tax=Pseudodesulfovibrio pelocollis TaxID=3051432 RepID=UPI00255AFED0|nr:hypothetical protein [Pseudodesulfovibrio sp. SB368]